MKIIDEEGMILGRVNVIDLTIIIFFLILLFTAYKYLYLKNYPQNILDKVIHPESRWVNVTVHYDALSRVLYDAADVGDFAHRQSYLEENVTISHIIKKGSYNASDSISNTGMADIVYDVLVEKRPDGLYYEGNLSTVAGTFEFKTDTYSLKGIISNISVGEEKNES